MPEMNGMEVIQELRRIDLDLPVIAMTGEGKFPAAVNLRTAELLGANAILQKPFSRGELERSILHLLPSGD